jgi:hypothetical protein
MLTVTDQAASAIDGILDEDQLISWIEQASDRPGEKV